MVEQWVERILEREGVAGNLLASAAEGYSTFDDFFGGELPDFTEQRPHRPGTDRRYSVSAFLEGEPLNCVGTAIVGGIIGTEIYDRDFEVVTELGVDGREQDPWQTGDYQRPVHDHVYLRDSDGNIFGGSLGDQATASQTLPVTYLDGLHAASILSDRRARGKSAAADEMYQQLRHHRFTDSEYINRQIHHRQEGV